ncbi:glycosyltransferase family protein [Desulfogranum mediterraneum]|uniref:glycosyltransferase family protein n=1 Tax=Desulfogranum mediterraneum TaxID=160661 RepID=UPI001E464917|nr:glycosyltransferase [Desulfogranum mediterraneum]
MSGHYNILIYSHDTYGLGHIRRTMAIAAHLRAPNVNVLILTGSPLAGRFSFPENVDFVRIPGMIKKTNDEYHSLSIRIDPEHALNIRQSIILSTAKTFRPNLFLVDKEPLGLKKEVLPTLEWLHHYSPETKTVLGLRDIMDDRETVRGDWENKGVYRLLDELYSEIWIYGRKNIYDAVEEYAIPASVEGKIHFTGYLPRRVSSPKVKVKTRKKFCVGADEQMIVVTTGGGGDGYQVMDCFLAMQESGAFRGGKSLLVTGPFMPLDKRRKLAKRGRKLQIKVVPFYPRMEELIGAADLVVSMGGYNTMCEILSQKTPSLIIPRDTPRKEQFLRARAFQKKGLIDYLAWSELGPEKMGAKVTAMLADLQPYQQAMDRFELKGIDYIKGRLAEFRATG